MTDRELLELAAKAAGQDYWLVRLRGVNRSVTEHLHYKGKDGETLEWNPLNDDGDALRLAVKLRIDLDQYADSVRCLRSEDFDDSEGTEALENLGQDPYAATRRAIVRAAAQIAKGMQ